MARWDLRIKDLNWTNSFRGESFLTSVGSSFHSNDPRYQKECLLKVREEKQGMVKSALRKLFEEDENISG